VIDLLDSPQLAGLHRVVAIPTLVRNIPKPTPKVIGDLTNVERIFVEIDIQPHRFQSA
jgi:circadian clock protein KaiB